VPSPVPRSPKRNGVPDELQPKRPWDRRTLQRQRQEFWETQTSGDAEAWGVVRMACEVVTAAVAAAEEKEKVKELLEDEDEGEEEDGGEGVGEQGAQAELGDAQGLLDAAERRCL
jgi:hypothetical protein